MGECSCARAAARGACSPWGADPRRGTPKGGWPLAPHTHRRRGPCVNTPFLTDSWLARSTGIEQWLLQSCHNKLDEGNDNFALCRALLEVCKTFGVFHVLTLQNFSSCCKSSWLCYSNYKWRRNFAKIQVYGRNSPSHNENGEKVFPGSFIFFPVKFSNVFLQSTVQNKSQMLWTAVSHPQSSPATYLLCQATLSGAAVLLQW